jgi:hypothetical protein
MSARGQLGAAVSPRISVTEPVSAPLLKARACSTQAGLLVLQQSGETRLRSWRLTVAVTKVVRAAEDAFEIHWEERILETGAPVRQERFTGALSILFSAPSTARLISKNPLGLYVDSFTWRRDSIGGARP